MEPEDFTESKITASVAAPERTCRGRVQRRRIEWLTWGKKPPTGAFTKLVMDDWRGWSGRRS
jgi:hypothetical protein